MIKYISRKNLDTIKYNTLINEAIQSRVYAYSWYLDIVSDNWSVLVLNDYEAVMPLPWRSKYFLKYIYTPMFVQQLGVFSKFNATEELLQKFIKKIPFYFVKIVYQFNSQNKFLNKENNQRVNYILDLNKNYDSLVANFNTNRKRNLKELSNYSLKLDENISKDEFYTFVKQTPKDFSFEESQLKKLNQIIEQGKKEAVSLYGVRTNNNLISVLLVLKDKSRITYLFPVNNSESKKISGATFLIIELLKKHANTSLIFDFEGSIIPGVASYYKSFGAEKEMYASFKRTLI